MSVKLYWEKLSAKHKRIVVVVAVLAVIILMVALVDPGSSASTSNTPKQAIQHVLTDNNTREVAMDSLSADIKILDKKYDSVDRKIDRMDAKLNRFVTGSSNNFEEEFKKLRQKIDDMDRRQREKNTDVDKQFRSLSQQPEQTASTPAADPQTAQQREAIALFEQAPMPGTQTPANGQVDFKQANPEAGLKIVSFSEASAVDDLGQQAEDEFETYLPSGSILTGVLLTGMDAPTSQAARRDPFPSTLRIQKEAILPNRFRADIRECFLILSGYGDLSSERAYLRGETLSCVREDGGVIEARLDSYAVGEDGKAGVRGRLVSKQGQIIAKSLMAGFLAGAAEAFDVNPVPVVSTNPGSGTQYQSVFSDEALQGAAAKGASKALDRVAQFYVEMAEGIFPVIEVDAGREVDIIVTKGMSLKVR